MGRWRRAVREALLLLAVERDRVLICAFRYPIKQATQSRPHAGFSDQCHDTSNCLRIGIQGNSTINTIWVLAPLNPIEAAAPRP